MVILKQSMIGVVSANMVDYGRWVANQHYDPNRVYFPITSVGQAGLFKYDEIIVTTTATSNSSYIDIYKRLNGATRLAKRESKPIY